MGIDINTLIRPSAVVSIEPSTFGACWVTLAVQHTGSKPHRVYVDMPADKAAKALGLVG